MDQIMTDTNSCFKKTRIGKTGYNVNNFINFEAIVNQFIEKYFSCICNNNIQNLIDCNMIREYTTIKFNKDEYTGQKLYDFLNRFKTYNINIDTFNYMSNGSRRIDIIIIGTMSNENETIRFNQIFTYCHHNNSWYIKNSIFMVFQ